MKRTEAEDTSELIQAAQRVLHELLGLLADLRQRLEREAGSGAAKRG